MNVKDALSTALEYEKRARDDFRRFSEQSEDRNAKMFFEIMAREEQEHVEYLECRLAEWRKKGGISEAQLSTQVPKREWPGKESDIVEPVSGPARHPAIREYLLTALRLEEEASEFYGRIVDSMDDPKARAVFRRFLEIEDGHTALVQAQIEYEEVTGDLFDLTAY